MNSSDHQVRAALADALARFPAWHDDLARLDVRMSIGGPVRDRAAMINRCGEIAREIAEVRTDLIFLLADTPRDVAGHSRVVDVEKALDNIESRLAGVQRKLEPALASAR